MELLGRPGMGALVLVAAQPPPQVLAGIPPRGEHPVAAPLGRQQHLEPLKAGKAIDDVGPLGKSGRECLAERRAGERDSREGDDTHAESLPHGG